MVQIVPITPLGPKARPSANRVWFSATSPSTAHSPSERSFDVVTGATLRGQQAIGGWGARAPV